MFSFSNRKKTVDIYPYIRRITDLTTPNLATVSAGRTEDRYNRTIPTLICPWEDGRPSVEECSVCLTSDMADRGVRLILNQPFHAEKVVLGYWIAVEDKSQPWFFLGEVRRTQPIGGGFWSVGIELTEFANTDHREELADLMTTAERLLPPVEVAT